MRWGRDISHLLDYGEWRNFIQTAIAKANTACEFSDHRTADHFVDVNNMVKISSGSELLKNPNTLEGT